MSVSRLNKDYVCNLRDKVITVYGWIVGWISECLLTAKDNLK